MELSERDIELLLSGNFMEQSEELPEEFSQLPSETIPEGFDAEEMEAFSQLPSETVPEGFDTVELMEEFEKGEETVKQESDCSNELPNTESEEHSAENHQENDGETAQHAESPKEPEKTEEEKRAEHEAEEAKRKAEWEERQQKKKSAEQEEVARLSAMSDDDVMIASMKRVSTDTEKLTRRNMKECVSEHVQTKCLEDSFFARLALHSRKTMIHCFHYINRKAREFIEQEMKDNAIKPENGVYGGDVPDDLCYQWAEEYFRDMDAEEDKEKEETFVPKAYLGKSSYKPGKKTLEKKKPEKKTAEKKEPEKKTEKQEEQMEGQISFVSQLSLTDYAKGVKVG